MYSLETERLILRPLKIDDIAFLDYLHSDIDVTRYTSGRTRSHSENAAYIITMLDHYTRGIGALMVIRKSDNIPIGRAGFSCFYGINDGEMDWFYWGSPDNVKREGEIFELAELGYTFAKPFWGKGYATEAAMMVRDHAYDTLGYNGFSSLVIKENTASYAVARKIGAGKVVDCMIEERPSFDLRNVKNG